MVHVVTAANRHFYEHQLIESFKIRHKIYVEGRGWETLRRPDGLERDQFDNDDAVYLLVLEGDEGRVIGGSRLVPTLKPHLMSEVFPQLASQRPLPRATNVFEWTRIFVVSERRGGSAMSSTTGRIYCAIQEYCLSENISRLSIVTEPVWIPRFLELGWNPIPLGLPIQHESGPVVGITVDVSEAILSNTRSVRGISRPVLVKRHISVPSVSADAPIESGQPLARGSTALRAEHAGTPLQYDK